MFSTILCFYFLTTPEVCATFSQIVRNKPNIDPTYAQTLSSEIVRVAKRYGIRSDIYTAILMQESGYDLKAINKRSHDYGIAQINKKTAAAFKLCPKKLTSDLSYSVEAGALVLSDFKNRWFKKEGYEYWSRYNTSNKEKRLLYKQKVLRHFQKEIYVTNGHK